MKYVKTPLPALVAAVALMGFLGVSSASATVLCKTQGLGSPTGTTCPAGWAYFAETELHAVLATGTKSITTTTFKTIECEESTLRGKTEHEGSATETVELPLEVLNYAKCNCEAKSCGCEPVVLKFGRLEIHWLEGTHNGTVTWTDEESTVNCSTIFGKVHCIYATHNTDVGTLTGGNPATLDIKSTNIPRLETDGLCDETSDWEATYQITAPTPLYVTGHT